MSPNHFPTGCLSVPHPHHRPAQEGNGNERSGGTPYVTCVHMWYSSFRANPPTCILIDQQSSIPYRTTPEQHAIRAAPQHAPMRGWCLHWHPWLPGCPEEGGGLHPNPNRANPRIEQRARFPGDSGVDEKIQCGRSGTCCINVHERAPKTSKSMSQRFHQQNAKECVAALDHHIESSWLLGFSWFWASAGCCAVPPSLHSYIHRIARMQTSPPPPRPPSLPFLPFPFPPPPSPSGHAGSKSGEAATACAFSGRTR